MTESMATTSYLGVPHQFLKFMTFSLTSTLTSALNSVLGWLGAVLEYDGEEEELQYTEEPHASRRRAILKKYPEVKKLMGHDSRIVYIILAEVAAQVAVCWLVQDTTWLNLLALSYFLGGMLNQSLSVALHDAGHNLAFGHRHAWKNRVLGILGNFPLIVPLSVTFKKYHADHHRYLGVSQRDTDVPARLELRFFRHPLTKLLWMVLHPFFYALRPALKAPKPILGWEVVNFLCQMVFNYVIYVSFGAKAVAYLFGGLFFGLSLHPLAAHFISEHYFLKGGNPTHSYYGPLNWVIFNAGYHVEHHDFPFVPYSRLPQVRRLAPEFYEHLPYHKSWVKVIWDFIVHDKVAPHASGEGLPQVSRTADSKVR